MKILVTGGAGFIGSHLCKKLQQEHTVLSVDNNDPHGGAINVDIANAVLFDSVVAEFQPDAIIHLAAVSDVASCEENPYHSTLINIGGTLNVLQSALRHNVKRFVFASSAAIYWSNSENDHRAPHLYHPQSESDLKEPRNVYGVQKLAAEGLVNWYAKTYKREWLSLRFFNVYGPGQVKGVIPTFIKAKKNGEPAKINGKGMASRDFVHVSDVVQAIELCLSETIDPGVFAQSFNIGSGESTQIIHLAERYLKMDVERLPENPFEVFFSTANIWKAQTRLGYYPYTPLEKGIQELLNEQVS